MKRSVIFILMAVSILAVMTSCATVLNGSKKMVTFRSSDKEIKFVDELNIDGKSYYNVALPFQAKVRRGFKTSTVVAKLNGYEDFRIDVYKKFSMATVFSWVPAVALGFWYGNTNGKVPELWSTYQYWGIPNETGNAVVLGTAAFLPVCDLLTGSVTKPAHKNYYIHFRRKMEIEQPSTPELQPDPQQQEVEKVIVQRTPSDVDLNIPETGNNAENTFVLIIANENYQFVDNVDFALNDGNTFKQYCVKTLGVPERQIWLFEDASYGVMNSGISKMVRAMDLFDNPKAIVYYCGHGIPDEKTGNAYIIPVDGNGKDMSTCYSLNKLYKAFADTKASNVTYFMDACFTGANKEGAMLVAARGVAREPKKEVLTGNSVVFSATSADETAMAFKEKQHGLFTYYLLKKLQETNGDVSYEELFNYINSNVRKEAFLTNDKVQTPVVSTSPATFSTWKNMNLKGVSKSATLFKGLGTE